MSLRLTLRRNFRSCCPSLIIIAQQTRPLSLPRVVVAASKSELPREKECIIVRNLNLEMKTILAFLFLLFLLPAQRTDFEVLPTASYNSSVASAQACLANC